jgi:hypothetical protein
MGPGRDAREKLEHLQSWAETARRAYWRLADREDLPSRYRNDPSRADKASGG